MANTELTHRQIMVIFSGLMMTMLLAILDQTIVATALPTIASDLGGEAHISWVPTSYLLTTTLAAPIYGKASDVIGRKNVYQLAIVIFLAGSIFSGLSQNMTELIAFRALQGLGGGGLMSLSFAIVGDIISPRERGKYQGYFSSLMLVGSVIGPFAGGFFTQELSWRWIFYINVPLGLGALVVTGLKLHLPRSRAEHAFDVAGAMLMVVAVTALVFALVSGGSSIAWLSPQIVGLFLLSACAAGALCWRETRAPDPLFPPRVFLHPVALVAVLLTMLLAAAQFAGVIYLPIYLQLAKGVQPIASGIAMFPLVLATAFSSIVSGRLVTRYGRYRIFPLASTLLMAVGITMFSRMDSATSGLALSAAMVIFGLGMGSGLQVLVTVIQNAVEARDLGVASSSMSFFRNIGASAGTAIFGTVLVGRLNVWLRRDLPNLHLSAQGASTLANPARLNHLTPSVRSGVTQAFVNSLHSVFLTGLPILLLALVAALTLREIPLGTKSAHDRIVEE